MNNLISSLKDHFFNVRGWRTSRKIVVFESDDWGMQRMPSKSAYESLLAKGYPVDKSIYNRFDSLESDEDLEALMEVLSSVKDKNYNPAIFTLNNILTNPDFGKILSSNYEGYHYELFTETLKKSKKSEKVFDLYQQGIRNKLFQTQYHGREHVHVNNWMRNLRNRNTQFLDAFKEGSFTINDNRGFSCRYECLDAMATYSEDDFNSIKESIEHGLRLFKEIWGFQSRSIIAPCYTWSKPLEKVFRDNGINYIQGSRAQREPISLNQPFKIYRNYCGKKSHDGLIYLVRNVGFEQIESGDDNIVNTALKQIQTSFFWGKPAIISSHRVNYIGSIDEGNRTSNLSLLKILLKEIVKRYPDVEFLSSDQLGNLMTSKEE
ncbi:hypothetical protein [Cecembia calidifontis]|uniref:Polysaccharide deacetylase n=1 Tax=Cecembia calidifontis TaxID=1187080 RepID=A0A4Q7PHR7_9BACT|nr:hypothetical protein [Cecembia calidifontis]RZS98462.1 hypothetical protein BC751_4117 [Cecembia calidifontis]